MSRFLFSWTSGRAGALIPAMAAVVLSGCMSWRSETLSPAQLIETRKPPVVRVTRADSSKVILRDPEVAGDTLFGRPQSSLEDTPGGRTGIPLAGIHSIATRKSDPTKSTLLVVGIGLATFTALCAADALGCGPDEAFLEAASGAR